MDNSTNGDAGNGLPVILNDVSAPGDDLTIYGNGATIERAGGSPPFRILQVSGGATCVIDNLAIAGGKALTYPLSAFGGGLFNNNSQVTLTGCTFTGNSATGADGFTNLSNGNGTDGAPGSGGAIYSSGNTMVATNCAFTGNSAIGGNGGSPCCGAVMGGAGGDGRGGAVSASALTLNNCTFTNNSAVGGSRLNVPSGVGSGGGVFTETGTLSVCTFIGNSSSAAAGGVGKGGGLASGGVIAVMRSTFRNNTASSGGGININGGTVTGSTLNNNSAASGGAISTTATVALTNCTFSSNSSTQYGGAMVSGSGSATVVGCTFSGNTTSGNGGGIYNAVNGTLSLANIILKSGASGANLFNDGGGITSQGYNLSNDNGGGFLTGMGDQINTDPQLGSLANNGGPTQTHALLIGSPAIDKGKSFGLTTDQRGRNRSDNDPSIPNAAGGDASDIGAFEAGGSSVQSGPLFVVNSGDDHLDSGANPCTTGDCSLREALIAANTHAGDDTISFASSVSGNINLNEPLPNLSTNLSILGPGANVVTVRRDTFDTYRIFTISNGTSSGPIVTITSLTVANGRAAGSSPNNEGGGIYNNHGALTLRNCAISGNHAAAEGGGLFNEGFGASAPLTIEGCTFSGNTAGAGGGFWNSAAVVTMSNCTFSGNSVSGGGGGITQGAAGSATLTMSNCTVSGNSASSNAGGIWNTYQSLTIANTIVASNAGGNFSSFVAIISQGHNLSSDAAGGDGGTGPGGYLTGSGDMRNTNPQLDSLGLQNNGGGTQTIALLSNSPAINSGDDTLAPKVDQRGYLRSGVTDRGAFEFGGGQLRITSIIRANGHIVLQCLGVPNQINDLQVSPDLSTGSFAPIVPAPPAADGTGAFQYDDARAVGLTKRFYRLAYP